MLHTNDWLPKKETAGIYPSFIVMAWRKPFIVSVSVVSEYCSLDFIAFDMLFKSTDGSRKKSLWAVHKGKYVKWTGEIKSVEQTFGATVVNFKHKPDTWTFDVAARFPNCSNPDILTLQPGQMATYTGRLLSHPGFFSRWEIGDAASTEGEHE
ncbi:MAG: hypothetical protein HY801_06470 [Candidatus Lindowbacteria bacterium]|nr:hypothetical protein [Candidatus Lindowbacteria bacterium]